MSRLTRSQSFLLEWLSKEESSALGECRGADLQVLLDAGFAELGPYPFHIGDENYRRVSLTPAGRAALAASPAVTGSPQAKD